MKGLMFNNKYGLEDAVINGTKTMTRRYISNKLINQYEEWIENARCINVPEGTSYETLEEFLSKRTPYEIGEVVAIKQSYKDINIDFIPCNEKGKWGNPKEMAGWSNKMFVRNDLMPHQVKITGITLQKLQDISNEDCLKEGITDVVIGCEYAMYGFINKEKGDYDLFKTPREAYATLIDKISGNGTWINNDWVWAIEFKLIK